MTYEAGAAPAVALDGLMRHQVMIPCYVTQVQHPYQVLEHYLQSQAHALVLAAHEE